MVKIIIAGSRWFKDYKLLDWKMTSLIFLLGGKYPNLNLYDKVGKNCFKTNPNAIEIISGHAEGADSLGEKFAERHKLTLKIFPAQWQDFTVKNCVIKTRPDGTKYNAVAGIARNEKMAKYAIADNSFPILALFWDGKSHGSKNMKKIAEQYEINIFETISAKPERIDNHLRTMFT